jgi:hypothetical protein
MAYLGNKPVNNFVSFAKQDIAGNGGTSYSLDYPVTGANDIELYINNVRQEPTEAYSCSGATLTLTGAITISDDVYVIFRGRALQTAQHPADSALEASQATISGSATVGGSLDLTTKTINSGTIFANDGDKFVTLRGQDGSEGTLTVADNGNLWINADGGKHLWLNWQSKNNPSLPTSLYVGKGNSSSHLLKVDGDSSQVFKPQQVAFLAYKTGGDEYFGVGSTLKYDATLFNIGNAYNTSNYTFTAPVEGRYLFCINANGANDQLDTGGVPRAFWKINGANVAGNLHIRGTEVGSTSSLEQRESTVIFQLQANDTVKVEVGQNTWDVFGANHFMGYLLG